MSNVTKLQNRVKNLENLKNSLTVMHTFFEALESGSLSKEQKQLIFEKLEVIMIDAIITVDKK